jgi:MFS family permease
MSAMATAQVVMVAIMTMTPLFLHQHAHGLHTVGQVIAAHIVGMFALSPLSGRLADRHGGTRVVAAGLATLILSAALAIGASGHIGLLTIAVTLLGYGWNLCFVGGSSLLAVSLPATVASRAEGHLDAVVWATSGVASLGAGALMAVGGYPLVAVVAAALISLPITIAARSGPGTAFPGCPDRAASFVPSVEPVKGTGLDPRRAAG